MTILFAGTQHCGIDPHGSHPGRGAPTLPMQPFLFSSWDDVGAYAQGVVIRIFPLKGCLEETSILEEVRKNQLKLATKRRLHFLYCPFQCCM